MEKLLKLAYSPMIMKWEIFYLVLMLCSIILVSYLCPGLFQKMLPLEKILLKMEKGSKMDIGFIPVKSSEE